MWLNRLRRLFVVPAVLLSFAAPALAAPHLVICGASDNDLVQAAVAGKVAFTPAPDARSAIESAPVGAGVLILADRYPRELTAIDARTYQAARDKNLHLYIEYPAFVPASHATDQPRVPGWERAVVTSGDFGPMLPALRLLAIHRAHFIPFDPVHLKSKVVLARVAGFDTAVYGLPKEAFPLLFEPPGDAKILIASTKLSAFVTARYAPGEAWRLIWKYIFAWLGDAGAGGALRWTQSVAPTLGRADRLPPDAELAAVRRGSSWFGRAGLLVAPSWKKLVEKSAAWPDRTGSLDAGQLEHGDGALGLLEGYNAAIDETGHQPVRWFRRADCNGEAAMAMAMAGKATSDPALLKIAANLNGFVYETSAFAKAAGGEADDPACGLMGWSDNAVSIDQFYGDDNARVMLGTIGAAAATRSGKWDSGLARCLLGNLRTTGRLGFRDGAISRGDLKARGWQSFFRRRNTFLSPHFESWLWACYLWAYEKSHYRPFHDRAVDGIGAMMAGYPGQWHWTNGLQQERARMLLPLAWLVRVEDTPDHRQWLRRIATDLLASQDACGAIREQIGSPGLGMFGPPASNAAYGTAEAPMIQENGDPLSDLLYTTNFAFVGLHEAAAATGDRLYRDAADRLAAFLCRIQIRSATHPELDGGWFRAFDYHRWDYWASSADFGWGAWSIETGWTQTWIVSVLSMRQMKTSLWDISRDATVAGQIAAWQPKMIPDAAAAETLAQGHVQHAAVGRPVVLDSEPSPAYAADGPSTLVDGKLAAADDLQSGWLGFEGKDFGATVDLGVASSIRCVAARFLRSVGPGIFLPRSVLFEASMDGKSFYSLGVVRPDGTSTNTDVAIQEFKIQDNGRQGRFIRVRAQAMKVCPPGHPAAGAPAWIFVDELIVNPRPG